MQLWLLCNLTEALLNRLGSLSILAAPHLVILQCSLSLRSIEGWSGHTENYEVLEGQTAGQVGQALSVQISCDRSFLWL